MGGRGTVGGVRLSSARLHGSPLARYPPAVRTRLQRALSHATGWLADRRIPVPLRSPLYRTYARATGVNLSETRGPLEIYPSLSAFFVRRLAEGARPVEADPRTIVSPVDGRLQSAGVVRGGKALQAKGRPYDLRTLLAGVGEDLDLEGAYAWTLYLGPRDYHRIHAPEEGRLVEVRWVPGRRHSVAPRVLARRTVLPLNERCVLRLESVRGPLLLALVGALNVGRIRVVGVPPGLDGALPQPRTFARGEELARFELGSTVVLITPPALACRSLVDGPGVAVRLGAGLGRYG